MFRSIPERPRQHRGKGVMLLEVGFEEKETFSFVYILCIFSWRQMQALRGTGKERNSVLQTVKNGGGPQKVID